MVIKSINCITALNIAAHYHSLEGNEVIVWIAGQKGGGTARQ